MPEKPKRVAVIGGGPAGMMAALFALREGARVTLLERNEKLGKKLCTASPDFPRFLFILSVSLSKSTFLFEKELDK